MGTCKICLKPVKALKCRLLEEILIEILDVLLIKLDLESADPYMICDHCVHQIEEAFDFKSTCIYTEDLLFPYIASGNNTNLVLEHVYLKEIGKGEELVVDGDIVVCRLCMKLITSCPVHILTDVFAKRNLMAIFKKYVPELKLSFSQTPKVCNICLLSFQKFADFVTTYLDRDKLICNEESDKFIRKTAVKQSNFVVENNNEIWMGNSIKNEPVDIKSLLENNVDRVKAERHSQFGRNFQATTAQEYSITKDKSFKCNGCFFKTKFKSSIIQHVRVHKKPQGSLKRSSYFSVCCSLDEIKTYKCKKCNFDTLFRSIIMKHILLHDETRRITLLKCHLCKFWTKNERMLKQHIISHKNRIFKCTICPYQSPFESRFKRHEMRHNRPHEFYCDKCAFKTKTTSHLNIHMRLNHKLEIPMFKCTVCKFETKYKTGLMRHQSLHNSTAQLYECYSCEYKTKRKDGLIEHMMCHKQVPPGQMHRCNLCSFTSKYKSCLRKHTARIHQSISDMKIFTCKLCGYVTIYKGSLARHAMIHDTKLYKCPSCEFQTKHKDYLQKHVLLMHEAPSKLTMYRCRLCDFKAKRKYSMTRHMITHQDVSETEMFKCSICPFTTKFKGVLRKHLLQHSERTHRCDLCEFQTKYKSYIGTHLKVVHKKTKKETHS